MIIAAIGFGNRGLMLRPRGTHDHSRAQHERTQMSFPRVAPSIADDLFDPSGPARVHSAERRTRFLGRLSERVPTT